MIRRTIALPTMTPSAIFETEEASSGEEIPKPTATGFEVIDRIVESVACMVASIRIREPVIPVMDT